MSNTDRLPLDGSLRLSVQRTLRIPDDGGVYPLPPALGRLPIRPASDYPTALSRDWIGSDSYLVALHAHEAAWLQFSGRFADPRAVIVGVGAINALSGLTWNDRLQAAPQNYIVCPYQPWLDGFKVGPAIVRQFVGIPLHTGESVEHQLTGRDTGGVVLACFAPRTTVPLPEPPRQDRGRRRELGLGAGGRIAQRVYPDPYGIDIWEPTPRRSIRLYLLEAGEFEHITGEAVPPSPIDVQTYIRFGLPWYETYDAPRGDIPASVAMSKIAPVDDAKRAASDKPPPDTKTLPVWPIPPRSRRRR